MRVAALAIRVSVYGRQAMTGNAQMNVAREIIVPNSNSWICGFAATLSHMTSIVPFSMPDAKRTKGKPNTALMRAVRIGTARALTKHYFSG
jgi:hypothetical protein